MEAVKRLYAIIVAAGSGRRFGSDVPKQFCELGGRPVLMTTIDNIRAALPGASVILVLNGDYADLWEEQCVANGFVSPQIVYGGPTRWASVKNALTLIPAESSAYVMVHDGARPFVRSAVTDALVSALDAGSQGAVPVVEVTDSLREISQDGGQSVAVDRSRFKAVQTPQAFRADLLKMAYDKPYSDRFTDDASVMECAGYSDIALVAGHPDTFKITLPRDLALARLM